MIKLKWFSGGNDRADQAITIITELLTDLNGASKSEPLQRLLKDYKNELELKESSVPYILSRMNIAISNVTLKNSIVLSKDQSEKINHLTKLSNIRYGY